MFSWTYSVSYCNLNLTHERGSSVVPKDTFFSDGEVQAMDGCCLLPLYFILPAPSPHPLPSAPHPQVGDNGDAFLARAGGQEKLVTAQSMATEFAVREAGDKEHIAEATLTNNAQDETIADLTTRLSSAEAAMKTMYEAHCTPPNMPCHAALASHIWHHIFSAERSSLYVVFFFCTSFMCPLHFGNLIHIYFFLFPFFFLMKDVHA